VAVLVKRNHWVVRLTHWVNVVAVILMAGSGMRIFNAHPAFARPGETFPLNPWEGKAIPASLTLGGWLAGARHWHFAAMWLLVANGLLYLGFLFFHGEWRDIVPRRGDARDAVEMLKFYLFARRDHPHQGKHNALQKSAYFAMPVLGVVLVLSGLAIWKPVTLCFVTALFVNYKWARFVHFLAMALLLQGYHQVSDAEAVELTVVDAERQLDLASGDNYIPPGNCASTYRGASPRTIEVAYVRDRRRARLN